MAKAETAEKVLTKPFSVEVRYTIQLPQETADFLVEQYREQVESDLDEYQRFYAIAEALEEAIAWRSAEIVDAVVNDEDDAANSFLEAMGVEE